MTCLELKRSINMTFKPIVSLLALSLPLLLVACPDPPGLANGTLAITFDNADAPSDFDGNVLVTGPDGFSQIVKRSQGVSVPPGTYKVSANPVRVSGSVVDSVFEGEIETLVNCCEASQDVVVTSGETVSLSVEYDPVASSGLLRLIGGTAALPVPSAVLESGLDTALPPRSVCEQDARGAALDAKLNLWVACADTGTLRQYTRLDFNPPRLGQTVTLPAGTQARGVAIDKQGNVWVVDASDSDRVLGYAKKDLELNIGGPIAPFVTIDVPNTVAGLNDKAEGIAFDGAGNLWVSTFTVNDSLLKFDAAKLEQKPEPSVILTFKSAPFPGVDFSLFTPKSIAFDKDGNLWASNNGNKTITKFAPPFVTGKQQPALMLTNVGDDLGAIAFDNAGALWVGVTGMLLQFTPDKLSLTGAIKTSPAVTLAVDFGAETSVSAAAAVFAPAPKNLPISQ
jgi:DNA-binding beta-propeller fold protein YncE